MLLSLLLAGTGCKDARPAETGGEKEQPRNAPVRPAITMMVPLFESEAPKADNPVIRAIEDRTGVEMQIAWIPSNIYGAKINATIASGEMPMALLASDDKAPGVINAVRSGLFWEIGPYLQDYPNLRRMDETVSRYAMVDGKLYGIYRYRETARNGLIVRKDWLNRLGLPKPSTIAELYETLRAFTRNDPDGNGKDDTFGTPTDAVMTFFYTILPYFGAPNNFGRIGGRIVPDFMTDEYLDAMKFMKRLYDDKLINRDFAAPSEWKETYFDDGKAGVFAGSLEAVTIFPDLLKRDPRAELDIVNRIRGPLGERVFASRGYKGQFMFPKSSVRSEEELRRLLEFFDKLSSKEMQNVFEWGIEGRHYRIVNGAPERNDELYNEEVMSVTQIQVSDNSLAMTGTSTPMMEKVKLLKRDSESIAVPDFSAGLVSETKLERWIDLNKIVTDARTQFIMGMLDEDGWRSDIARWRRAGGDKIIEELTAAYERTAAP